jgi:propanol-preferring alcohol dehydrogenase
MTRAPNTMQALRVHGPHTGLALDEIPVPTPGDDQVLLRVLACGVCRTDLHVLDAELPNLRYPITPGHEIVGRVVQVGARVDPSWLGQRAGVPWLARTCGTCNYCKSGLENLCENAQFTGYTVPGGYAEYVTADSRYCLRIPDRYSDAAAAPLLCAGLIGYRAYRAAGDAQRLGLYGFGAAAHILAQVARADRRRVYAFTRPGDSPGQEFATRLGAVWAGGSDEAAPEPLDAAIIFAPVGALVPSALAAIRPGGRVVCAGIHMSDIPGFPYRLLWEERSLVSVANLTRADGAAFMQVAAQIDLNPVVEQFELADAPKALARLKEGRLRGAAVLVDGAKR